MLPHGEQLHAEFTDPQPQPVEFRLHEVQLRSFRIAHTARR